MIRHRTPQHTGQLCGNSTPALCSAALKHVRDTVTQPGSDEHPATECAAAKLFYSDEQQESPVTLVGGEKESEGRFAQERGCILCLDPPFL